VGDLSDKPTPTTVSGGHSFIKISCGVRHTCALKASGEIMCWGLNSSYQVGYYQGNTVSFFHATPVTVVGGYSFSDLDAGGFHNCAQLSSDGTISCWGWNQYGTLGIGSSTENRIIPTPVSGEVVFSSIEVGIFMSCGVLASDPTATYCFGMNDRGGLGDGTFTNRSAPVQVQGSNAFTSLSAGGFHVCGLLGDGTAMCWGQNSDGEVGDCTNEHKKVPTAVQSGNVRFSALSSGYYHTCGVYSTNNDAILCWGSDEYKQLGDNVLELDCTTDIDEPGIMGAALFPKPVLLSGGGNHFCFLASPGSEPKCWGANTDGQLADGTTVNSAIPKPIGQSFYSIATVFGDSFSCFTKEDGAAWCVGDGNMGQLGNNDTVDSYALVEVVGGHKFIEMAAGQRHMCGLTAAGAIYCWG